MSMLAITNFTKGELSPELQARIDTGQYQAGVRKATNFIIQRYGGLSLRPGFRLVGEADSVDKNVRYIPFQFNIEQSYVLTFEDYRARLLTTGGIVSEDNVRITAITREPEPLLTIPFHAYSVGDRIYFNGIVGMEELNGLTGTVTAVISDSQIRISIDTSNFGTFVSSDGVLRVGAPPAPPTPPTPPTPAPPPPDPPPAPGGGGTGGGIGELPNGGGLEQY